jgi:polyribonucleotide nucleotidyltransferase
MSEKITAQVGDKQIIIETGKLAKQADGAVTVQLGETIVIVAAVAATKAKEGQDFFPLTVDYREKAAAAGKFPGGYFKREGRPTEKEILTCRLTDRPIRPLFPKGWYNEVQVQTVVLSADGENDPDILSIIGASASLMVSDIPWAGPLGAVRVGRINGKFIAYPTHAEQAESDLDLVYVGNEKNIVMYEGSAKEISEADFNAALQFGQECCVPLIAAQRNSPPRWAGRNAKSRLTSFRMKSSRKPRSSPATVLCPRCSRPANSPAKPPARRSRTRSGRSSLKNSALKKSRTLSSTTLFTTSRRKASAV